MCCCRASSRRSCRDQTCAEAAANLSESLRGGVRPSVRPQRSQRAAEAAERSPARHRREAVTVFAPDSLLTSLYRSMIEKNPNNLINIVSACYLRQSLVQKDLLQFFFFLFPNQWRSWHRCGPGRAPPGAPLCAPHPHYDPEM